MKETDLTNMTSEQFEEEMKKILKKCLRCEHIWFPRSKNLPIVCPKCKSPYWNKIKEANSNGKSM